MDLLSVFLWFTYLFVTSFFLISLITGSKLSYAKKLPPGPTPLPILGNLLQIAQNMSKLHKFLAELSKVHGQIMTIKLGSITTIIISSPTIAQKLLRSNHEMFSSNPYLPLDATGVHQHDVLSVATLPPSSSMWKTLRKIFSTRLLSDQILDVIQAQRRRKVNELLSYVEKCAKDNVPIDIGSVVYDASYNIVSNTMFSTDERGREIKDLIVSIITEIGRPNIADCYPALKIFDPQRIRHRLKNLSAKLFDLFDEIIEDRLKSRKDRPTSSGSSNDLLDVILDIMEEQKDVISRDHVHHLVMDFISAGVDATSRTIEWAMTELLANPKILRKCQEEIDNLVGIGKVIEESDIPKLAYLQAVIKETFRLHPAVPLLLPRTVENEIEINGYFIPKGAQVIINVWAIHNSSSWDNPDLFYPDRFLGSNLDVKGQHSELIPFSTGRKTCPGHPLALRMVSLMLASLIGSFNWKIEEFNDLHDEFSMDDKFNMTLRKAKPLRAFPVSRV